MRGELREGTLAVGQRFITICSPWQDSLSGESVEHAVACCACCFGVSVGSTAFGRLRQRDQQCSLRRGQASRFLAEPCERSGADTFEIAAKGRVGQVEIEDTFLVQPPFEGQRHPHLAQLAGPSAGWAVFDQPGHLHGQGRATGHRLPVCDGLSDSAQQGQRIDAPVAGKAAVLVADQHPDIGRVHLGRGHRQAPEAVTHLECAQQHTVAVAYFRRGLGKHRRQHGRIDPAVERILTGTRHPQQHHGRKKQPRGVTHRPNLPRGRGS